MSHRQYPTSPLLSDLLEYRTYASCLFLLILGQAKTISGSSAGGLDRLGGRALRLLVRIVAVKPRAIRSDVQYSGFGVGRKIHHPEQQCFGSGSGRIRIIWSDPDPYQETSIWIRVAPKINQNHGINKSKWFVNLLFT